MFLFGLILILVIFVLHTVNLILITVKKYKKKNARIDVPQLQMWLVSPGAPGNYSLYKYVEDYYSKKEIDKE